MKKIIHILVVGLLGAFLASCTSARWTVKEKSAVDESDYEIIEQDNFLIQSGEVSPDSPVLKLEMVSKTKFEYTERVLMQRTIQDYKLRPGFLALGLSGAAMAFYLANSHAFRGSGTSTKSVTLNSVGALLALSGFLNMKPVGEPRPTGEERYLRSTGSTIKIDTVKADEDVNAIADLRVRYGDKIIFEEGRDFTNGSIEITLASKLNELQLTGPKPGSLAVNITFEDSVYVYKYPIEQVLQPYAKVTSQLTALRNSPEESIQNVLADLVKGSQLKIKSSENEDWYQVLYGISENYIRKEDAQLIWRSADFIEKDQVVTVPRVPFGNIDVESNIPILRRPTPNSVALILTNENYSGGMRVRNYSNRDGRLMKAYLKNALGYPEHKIFELSDVSDSSKIYDTLFRVKTVANDSTELFVYLSGHGAVKSNSHGTQLQYLGVSGDNNVRQEISLKKLFEEISSIPSSKKLVLSDIDFSSYVGPRQFTSNAARKIIEANAAPLINNSQASLLMGTRLTNPSSLYVSSKGEDKKHHIFPYFFAKALQQRRTNLSDIYQYLERNISYTARRLFDRPQDPLLLGNASIDLVSR